ncbi:ABC-type polysaccharide transport system permease subunit [Bradyrhizobium sp. LM2.7]
MSLAEPTALPVTTSVSPRLHILKRFSTGFKASLPAYLLLLPSLFFLALFTYGAMGRVLVDALYQRATPKAPVRFVGLDNIGAVLADSAFTGAVVNNLIYAVGTAIPSIALALLFALALSRTNAVTSALRAALFLPVLIPMVAASALFLFIFLPNVGLLDYYIGRLLPVLPNWLGNSDIALYAIMIITIWKNGRLLHAVLPRRPSGRAGSGAADRAEFEPGGATRPLRHAHRGDDALFRLCLRHLPDAPGF